MIFITGTEGFIGSYLIKRLIKENIPFKMSKGDIRNYKSITKQMTGCDTVIHLAALKNMEEGEREPFKYFDNNVVGTFSVVQAALKTKIKKFILPSSLAVVYNRGSTYALTKILQEEILRTYYNKMTTIIFRITSVYDRNHGIIGWLLKSDDIKIYGDGSQVRDFIHVSDVVEALLLAIKWKGSGFTCDVGTGRGISIKELVELTGKSYKFIPSPNKEIDPPFSVANPVPAQKILGFTTRVPYRKYIPIGMMTQWK